MEVKSFEMLKVERRIRWEKTRSEDAYPSDSGKKLEGHLGSSWWGRALCIQWP